MGVGGSGWTVGRDGKRIRTAKGAWLVGVVFFLLFVAMFPLNCYYSEFLVSVLLALVLPHLCLTIIPHTSSPLNSPYIYALSECSPLAQLYIPFALLARCLVAVLCYHVCLFACVTPGGEIC
ncbi:hypothetical protein QBC36DRAFT_339103 [Triangularia setosa]|uniref:Uncharacterized protein n=1 Tax=Triangularia setosa TaxID=2587417 RepID=A0AAN6VY02_9PEZI|nr:hypothetical protein QBC36DRAFT_339103 [Podospora setosa]